VVLIRITPLQTSS